MLGDTALAIHPADERTAGLRGRKAVLPIMRREIPIVEDPILVDREFGTGVVKVTPAHDANDFASARRLNLPAIVVIGGNGKMTSEAGEYAGLDRFEARKRVVARLEEEGRLVKTEPHTYNLGYCQRCDTVIEPYLSNQWFVKIQPLADPAIEAVEKGRVRFAPESWTKTYMNWMRDIHDWCISRQLWWGHRIPAFTCPNGHVTVTDEDPSACGECGAKELTQDPDVLDTWFSSQLWPFSVMGWPEQTPDMKDFYPTDVLVTGYDILFFWVARMIMAGLRFTGKEPFHTVHLHGLVRVGGEKMSKTKGNVIDPLEAIREFGADAVRFTLASASSSGPTVSVERGRMVTSRNFATKVWNAARFALPHLEGRTAPSELAERRLSLADRWILSRFEAASADANRQLEAFRFDEAADAIYAYVWNDLCDWYLEIVKPILAGSDAEAAETVRGVLRRCLEGSLALLHPFMPFVTEEIWEKLTGRPGTMIVSAYPRGDGAREPETEAVVEAFREVVTRVRNFRKERDAKPAEPVSLTIDPASPDRAMASAVRELSPLFLHMARLDRLTFGPAPSGSFQDVVSGLSLGMSLAAGPSPDAGARVEKSAAAADAEIAALRAKLQNSEFLEKAPPPVVQKARTRLFELEEKRAALARS
jgi:valyl-tRNA synthetase